MATKTIGQKTYVDIATGEKEVFDVVSAKKSRRRGFYIVYQTRLLDLLDFMGPRGKIIKFILEKMDNEQKLVMTTLEISKNTKLSKKTVISTLKLLEDKDYIVRITGCIFVNPMFINCKNEWTEYSIYCKYEEIKKKKEETK